MMLCKPQWSHTGKRTGRTLNGGWFLHLITHPGSGPGSGPHGPESIIYQEIITLTPSMASKLPSGFAALKSWLQAKKLLIAESGFLYMLEVEIPLCQPGIENFAISLYSGGRKYLETISELWQEAELIWAIAQNNRRHGWQVNGIERRICSYRWRLYSLVCGFCLSPLKLLDSNSSNLLIWNAVLNLILAVLHILPKMIH